MKSKNRVSIIGNVGRDVELKHFPSGDPYCNIAVATSERYLDARTGEKRETPTQWHNCECHRRLAEIAAEYCKKGAEVAIDGKIQYEQWEKDGVKQYATKIIVYDMYFFSGGKPMESQPVQQESQPVERQNQQQPESEAEIPAPAGAEPEHTAEETARMAEEFFGKDDGSDDGIPM